MHASLSVSKFSHFSPMEKKKTPEFAAAIQGHPKAINIALTRLVEISEIVKVKRGVYRLPKL